MTAVQVDLDEGVAVIRSAKKRGRWKGRHFRSIPLPQAFLDRLDRAHDLRDAQARPDGGRDRRLWPFARTTAWRRMRVVMNAAGLGGVRACAKGLRHSYGVAAALQHVPQARIRTWLGHASLETTAIYLDMVGAEDRAMAERVWRCGEAGNE